LIWRRILWLGIAATVPLLQARLDRRMGEFQAQEEVLYLWSGKHVRALMPGLELLAADLYWIRTVQYFGGQRIFAQGKNFDLLLPLINITVTLDPRFDIAYRYGAIFLSEARPIGAGRPEEGVALLRRGTEAMPQSWRLRQELGFFYFTFLNDAETASQVLLEASEIPGAPFWLRSMAARFLVKGGEREAARQIWTTMYEHAEKGPIKENARIHLENLNAVDEADKLNRAVADFQAHFQHLPRSLEELQRTGFIRTPPVDRSGTLFAYDRETGRVTISKRSPFWRPE
jgi:hypothetical protein